MGGHHFAVAVVARGPALRPATRGGPRVVHDQAVEQDGFRQDWGLVGPSPSRVQTLPQVLNGRWVPLGVRRSLQPQRLGLLIQEVHVDPIPRGVEVGGGVATGGGDRSEVQRRHLVGAGLSGRRTPTTSQAGR